MTWQTKVGSVALAGAAVALLFAAPAAASTPLQVRVEARISGVHLQPPANVQVEVRGDEAVLSGSVATVNDLWAVERAARKETKHLVDNVTVEPAKSLSDAALGKAIEKAVLGYPYYGVFDAVGFSVNDGKVVLTGSVNQPFHKSDIDDRVSRIVGVRALSSKITVQSFSSMDSRLRWALYRRIYGNPVFSRLAINPDPPIRIIVDNQHVTLAGVVDTKADRQLATVLAGQVSSFGPVKNSLLVEKARPKKPATTAELVG